MARLSSARRAFLALRDATGRIHAPSFWRALYWLLARRVVVRAAAGAFDLAASRTGTTGRRIAERLLVLLRGWPHHMGTPWVNLDVERFHRRVVWELERRVPRQPARRPAPAAPARIGVLARFDVTHFYTPPFFAAAPDGVEVVAFDLESLDPTPPRALASAVSEYHAFTGPEALAQAIEDAGLDLLLVDVKERPVDPVFDRLTVPCVAALCAEVRVRHHPRVDFHLYCLRQADYVLRDDHLFCGTSRARFSQQLVFPTAFPYEDHDLRDAPRPPWGDRDPLIVLHGRLRKASQPYLDVVFRLLAEDSDLTFVAIGEDVEGAVDRLRATARAFGVESRFEYAGVYTPARDEAAQLADPAWDEVFGRLRRARLAPDPWPLAGGITRLEAFLCGAPVVHMGIREDPAAWGRPQPMVTADHPPLVVPRATAYDADTYATIASRLLHDEAFADAVAAEQLDVALRVTDREAFWRHLLDCYQRWLGS